MTKKNPILFYGIIGIVIISALLLLGKLFMAPTSTPENTTKVTPTIIESVIATAEQQAIELWIKENDLNFFGDPNDTTYAGGTPLFNETTGKTTERFEYIVQEHPDRPWMTNK